MKPVWTQTPKSYPRSTKSVCPGIVLVSIKKTEQKPSSNSDAGKFRDHWLKFTVSLPSENCVIKVKAKCTTLQENLIRCFLHIARFYLKKKKHWVTLHFGNFQNISNPLLAKNIQFSSIQSLSRVRLFATLWMAAHQASLSITNHLSLLKLMSFALW